MTNKSADWLPGKTIEVPFPFYRSGWGHFGETKQPTWIPGALLESDDYDAVMNGIARADGMGVMRIEIVSRHKPGKYPERIFYVRQWVDPAGKVFGNTRLRITTLSGFSYRLRGYREAYRIEDEAA